MNDWVVGIDLGGTKIEIGLVNSKNQIVGRRKMPTLAVEGPQSVVDRIARGIAELASLLPDGERIAAAGICTPGPVDHETGTLIDPPNLAGLHNTPLRQLLVERLKIPVNLEHDAKAAALGEFYFGAGRGEENMVFIVVGTGVGGAIIVDGKLFRGPYNSAGEIGHVTLDRNGDLCSCGCRGCVETFIAGPWLARRYQRYIQQGGLGLTEGQESVTGEQVVVLAGKADPLAQKVMNEAGEALGTAVASLSMILNNDLFVIGGSVAKSGELLLEPARKALPEHSYRSVGCGIRIVATELGDEGPILGCAWLARQALNELGRAKPDLKPQHPMLHEQESLEKVQGYVFDIQRFSLHDGPGLRTNIFLKGCALRCPWCANPESQQLQPELALIAQQCINCNQFAVPCSVGWSHNDSGQVTHNGYGERAAVCPTCALRWLGERRTAGDVMAEVLRDLPFYQDGGGMTLTGGEPTFQPRMAEALLRLAKASNISTAIETSGYTRWKILERLLPYLDNILFDVKHLDSALHKAVTGVDNELILANLRKLAALNAPVSIRVPLIPGFNATLENIDATARFVEELEGLKKSVCLLPYHVLGRGKYKALGRSYPWDAHDRLSDQQVSTLANVVASHGLKVTIGG